MFRLAHSSPLPAQLSLLQLQMSRHPTVKWAQRHDKVYITVDLTDAKDVNVKVEEEGRFIFSATKDGVPYGLDLQLFDAVNVKETKSKVGVRSIVCAMKKAENKWWDRLLKQEGKPPVFLKIDWDKWVDEDDDNDNGKLDFNDMDLSKPSNEKKATKKQTSPLHRLLRRLKLNCCAKP